jgi:uncharacterized membrane protein (DUF485 family)
MSNNAQQQPPNWSRIAKSKAFRSLLADKARFIVPTTLFFLAFYFTLPIMTSYSQVLNQRALGAVTWAWVFAFAQFIMTWMLCALYTHRAAQFDEQAARIVRAEEAER